MSVKGRLQTNHFGSHTFTNSVIYSFFIHTVTSSFIHSFLFFLHLSIYCFCHSLTFINPQLIHPSRSPVERPCYFSADLLSTSSVSSVNVRISPVFIHAFTSSSGAASPEPYLEESWGAKRLLLCSPYCWFRVQLSGSVSFLTI